MLSFRKTVFGRQELLRWGFGAGLWFLSLLYMEVLLHVLLFGKFTAHFRYAAGFTAAISLGISGLLGMLPRKVNRIVTPVLMGAVSFIFGSQLVYHAVFGTMYSMSLVGMGGQALTNFWRETLRTMLEELPALLGILVPTAVSIVLAVKKKNLFAPGSWAVQLLGLILAGLVGLGVYQSLSLGGTGYYTSYDFFHSKDTTTDQAAQRFGLLTTMGLELFSPDDPTAEEEEGGFLLPVQTDPLPTEPSATLPSSTDPDAPGVTEPTEPPVEYNVLDIDFDYLNSLTEDQRLLELNAYVRSLSPTNKNEYTGMLADYNLITICAESFATGAIDPELMPTLYKLSTEGFVFTNYYNSYPNVTTDGEYSFCLGLWPDTSRGKDTASFYASRNSYLPFALGNIFASQAGISPWGYHNYKGSYYGRYLTHPNMGYRCKFMSDGMDFTSHWPSSDLEMMEQSVGDFISASEQFHAYYMTFSGHYKYDQENPMAARNYKKVKDLPYSEATKCYLACNYELEKAMAYLMEQLEAAGVADKTAIVLTGDHFPYGLTNHQYSQLVGYPIDDFSKYKSTLIFWVGGLEEPIYVDEYMCNIDILPTILNLWGFQYDSRLLAGTDVFSDGQHIAVLRDQSFLTDRVWFNASTGEVIWQVDPATVNESYVDNMIRLVKNQFTLSERILNDAYYNFLFEKGNVEITDDAWRKPQPQEPDPSTPT